MASFIKELMPPFLYKKLTQKGNKKRDLYDTYDQALKDSTKEAYENNELIRVIFDKTKIYKAQLDKQDIITYDFRSANMLAGVLMAKNTNNIVNVLDFGGACGVHYFEVRKGLPASIRLNWVVVETPVMVDYGQELANAELSFEADFSKAVAKMGNVDLLYTSGTIQCVDKPFDYLSLITSSKAKFILFNRLGLALGNKNLILVHESMLSWNGVGPLPEGYKDKWIKYPFQFIRKGEFESIMSQNYKALFDFSELSGIFPVNNEKLEGKGILYEHKQLS